jgi:hypothetical protein
MKVWGRVFSHRHITISSSYGFREFILTTFLCTATFLCSLVIASTSLLLVPSFSWWIFFIPLNLLLCHSHPIRTSWLMTGQKKYHWFDFLFIIEGKRKSVFLDGKWVSSTKQSFFFSLTTNPRPPHSHLHPLETISFWKEIASARMNQECKAI